MEASVMATMQRASGATKGGLHRPKARRAADSESREALANNPAPARAETPGRGVSQYSGAVRTVSVELKLTKEQWPRLLALSDSCRELANCAWQTWLVAHIAKGTAAKIRECLAAAKAWRDSGQQGPKPKFDGGFAVDADTSKKVYRACCDTVPSLTPASVSAFLQIFTQRIGKRKASNGSLPGWWAILLCRESLPSSTRSQPIPLRAAELSLAVNDGKWTLTAKASRAGFGKVITDSFPIIAGTWQTRSVTAILERIASGEHKLCGSSLVYSPARNKWFAKIGYQLRDKPAESKGTGVAVLRAGKRVPWKLRIGRSMTRGGRGDYVTWNRKQLLTNRWSRQSNYRHAGSANKGHGRDRALLPIEKLSSRWKDFVRTANQQLAKSIVDECAQRGVGTLVYIQPSGGNRFLETAGKIPGRRDSTGWDWYQVRTCLANKCEECGLTLVVRKSGERLGGDVKAGGRSQAKGGKGLDRNGSKGKRGRKAG
jgi:hypothetical protein